MAPLVDRNMGFSSDRIYESNSVDEFVIYYFICEGQNTETNYFKGIKNLKKELNIKENIEIIVLDKTDEDANKSNAKNLFDLAKDYKKKSDYKKGDKIVLVFDIDQYKSKKNQYQKLIKNMQKDDDLILCVTSPCFELWLLMHYDDVFATYDKNEMFKNEKKSNKHRYLSEEFLKKYGKNSKKAKTCFENLILGESSCVQNAIRQEKDISQNIECFTKEIGSNIGIFLEKLIT